MEHNFRCLRVHKVCGGQLPFTCRIVNSYHRYVHLDARRCGYCWSWIEQRWSHNWGSRNDPSDRSRSLIVVAPNERQGISGDGAVQLPWSAVGSVWVGAEIYPLFPDAGDRELKDLKNKT